MKRTILILLMVSLLTMNLLADGNAALKEITVKASKLIKAKKYADALQTVDEGIAGIGKRESLLRLRYRLLVILKRYDDAMAMVQHFIREKGENRDVLIEKFKLLVLTGKNAEAERVIPGILKIAPDDEVWSCIDIAKIYLSVGNGAKGFGWIDTALKKGFIDYDEFARDDYETFRDDERLKNAIKKIKEKVGQGKTAKDFTVKLLTGGTVTLSQHKGKVVLVEFWATTCNPCKKYMPRLKKFYSRNHPQGFEIIGISMDSNKEKLETYLAKSKPEWNIAFSGKGWADETRILYGINSIPSYWVVDKKGVLRYFGWLETEMEEVVKKLLAEK